MSTFNYTGSFDDLVKFVNYTFTPAARETLYVNI
jgi:hypothetical protein